MTPALQQKIQSLVDDNKILIFMKGTPSMPQCGFSAATIQAFASLGYPFETVNILEDPELRQGIKEFSNWPTIPQVYVGGEFIGGCDIVLEMHSRGELKPLVQEAVEGVTQA
jgi:monothiol glutaredoxin